MIVTPKDRAFLLRYVGQLQQHFEKWFYAPVQSKLGQVMPDELVRIKSSIERLYNELQQTPQADYVLLPESVPVAKLAVEVARRNIAEEQERLRELTVNVGVHRNIDELMNPIRSFQESDWFPVGESFRLPPITDFLTLESAYQVLKPYLGSAPNKEFDSKFGILRAQKSFFAWIDYARIEASLRNTDTTVAFADIDDFKRFNDELTETVVDREVLRPVMRTIESHCYSRGDAFLFGGDEYVILLPNMSKDVARKHLFRLQDELGKLTFSVTDVRIRVSIGCCTFPADSHYTDQEILDIATVAKAFAKKRKNCIAIYNSNEHTVESLINIGRNDLVLGATSY